MHAMLTRQIAAEEAQMTLLSERVLGDAAIISALAAGDKQHLFQAASPVFQAIKGEYGVSQMSFHSPDRVNLLRVHQPESSGDRISRTTLARGDRKQAHVRRV